MYGRITRHRPAVTATEASQRRIVERAWRQLPASRRYRLNQLASRERILQTAIALTRSKPRSAGPDAVRPSDLRRSEIAAMAGQLAQLIANGTYRPGAKRRVAMPKPDGGVRTLRLPNFADKVVARLLLDTLSPLAEVQFADVSHGFRFTRSVWTLLARLKHLVDDQRLRVLAIADVEKAFDMIAIDQVMEAHRQLLANSEVAGAAPQVQTALCALIETVLRGGHPKRRRGIDTGCPYSPLALNIYFDSIHDRLFTESVAKPFWTRKHEALRYVDNLVYPCRDVPEGSSVLEGVGRHLLTGQLALKQYGGIYDLEAGHTVPNLLGFEATFREGGLSFHLAGDAIQALCQHLDLAWDNPNPQAIARQVVNGWLAHQGPTFGDGRSLIPRVITILSERGFREGFSDTGLQTTLEGARERWLKLLAAMGNEGTRSTQ